MAYSKLEYIWLDGYKPTQGLRSKTKIVHDFSGKLEDAPIWSFDGSSTQQAEGGNSDCLLKPVAIFPDPEVENGYLIMNEVLNADGTPHESNGRATIDEEDEDFWFGYEQEYFLVDPETDLPLGFPNGGYPAPQGPYYCGVGARAEFGREIIDEHIKTYVPIIPLEGNIHMYEKTISENDKMIILQLEKDDYTFGKLIEKYIYNHKSNYFKFVAFKKEHPHDKHSLVQLVWKEMKDEDTLKQILLDVFKKIKQDIQQVKEVFSKNK